MTGTGFATRYRRRVVAAVASLTTVAAMGIGALGTPASAAGPFNSSTSLVAAIAENGLSITMTATAHIAKAKNGLGLTPTGSIHFSDDAGDDLGTVNLPSCLFKPCSVTETVSTDELTSDVSFLTATFSGDTLLKASTGSTPLALTHCPGIDDNCDAYVEGDNAQLQAESDSDTGYIIDNFGGPGLPCGVDGGGPVGNVNAVGLDSGKEIYYMITGTGAQAYNTVLSQDEGIDWFCYVSPDEFDAYSQDGNSTTFPTNANSFNFIGPAPLLDSGPYSGDYVGLLADCGNSALSASDPCISDYAVYDDPELGWDMHADLLTPPGDPHFGGLKLPALKV